MQMKKSRSKVKGLTYEPVGVTRWNTCQIIAKTLYHSDLTDEEIANYLPDLKEYLKNNK